MSIDHAQAWPLLHDLVDGELLPEQAAPLEAHLEECDACTAEVEFLLTLREAARALPREIAPPRDLWGDIAARLEPRSATPEDATVIPIGRVVRVERPRWQRWGMLAAAAAVVMAVSSAVTVRLMQDPALPPVATGSAPIVQPEPRAMTSLAAFEPTEREYLGALEELEAEFRARQSTLSPETRAVVEENLRIIDGAIAEIRRALEAEPASVELPLLLSGVYRSKVELLESTMRLYSQT